MLVVDGGGGSGTSWSSMSMDKRQTLIQNPEVEKHWELLTGWRRSADLINEHRSQVLSYRDNLATAWPPEKSPAAAAYLVRLDELIANLTETYEAAISNHTAFSSATLSLSLAQKEMNKIYQEYTANENAMAAYTLRKQQQAASSTPTPTPSPSGGDKPPVAPGRQEELERRSIALLSSVSGDLALAQMNIRTPTLYAPPGIREEKPPGEGGGGIFPPPIPPITPQPTIVGPASPSEGGRVTFPTGNSSPTGVYVPTTPQPNVGQTQPGLVLGGAPTSTVPQTPSGLPPAPSPSQGLIGAPSPTPSPGLAPRGLISGLPGSSGTPLTPGGGGVGRGLTMPPSGAVRSGGQPPGGIRPMPPGGMIGGVPGTALGQPVGGRPGINRVNPVGGVIGGTADRGSTLGRGGANPHMAGAAMPYGRGTSKTAAGNEHGNDELWDPDNPWMTDKGVDPVVMPAPEVRIDPGPAIGLR